MPTLPPTTSEIRRAALRQIGAAIMAARRAKGLSRRQAADWAGVAEWTLVAWEQGTRNCPAETRRKMVAEWEAKPKDLALDAVGDACPCCGRRYQ